MGTKEQLVDYLIVEHDFLHRVLDETNHTYTVNIGSFTSQQESATAMTDR